jgi:tetratricopeptide (TPR) repeat protein
MFELVLVMGFGLLSLRNTRLKDEDQTVVPKKVSDRLGKLWDIAHQGMRDNRFMRAEKALLTILKIDKKNAAAYNRLGILYAKQKEYKDAIDCFEIASSIEPTASSLHNLGLIYYETENYEKAAIAFENALRLEDALAARHIAYAKVQEQLGNTKLAISELEIAAELEPNKESLTILQQAYRDAGLEAEADIITDRLKKLTKRAATSRKRVKRPRRVVI